MKDTNFAAPVSIRPTIYRYKVTDQSDAGPKFELPGCRKVHSNRALRPIDRERRRGVISPAIVVIEMTQNRYYDPSTKPKQYARLRTLRMRRI
jgi:hypothetical protein